MDFDLSDKADLFKALGDSTRLKILSLLMKDKTLCNNKIAQKLGITPSAVSQHMKVLKHAELILGNKKGFYMHYELNGKNILNYYELLSDLVKEIESKKERKTCPNKKCSEK